MAGEGFKGLGGRPAAKEGKIVYDATMGALTGVRRVLMLLSGLIGLLILSLFFWYLGWDNARLVGRQAVLRVLESGTAPAERYSPQDVSDLKTRMTAEEAEIKSGLGKKVFKIPLIGMDMAGTDFPVALLLSAAALLLWLLFYQRRLAACVERLAQLSGWGVVLSALQFHFLLVGRHATRDGRAAVAGLIYGLPVMGLAHFASDAYDLYVLSHEKVSELAFQDADFQHRLLLRLVVDLLLVVIVYLLARTCFREYSEAEQRLTRIFDMSKEGRPQALPSGSSEALPPMS